MSTLTPKPMTDEELMDRLQFVPKGVEQVFICDLCGAWALELGNIRHKSICPDAGVNCGD